MMDVPSGRDYKIYVAARDFTSLKLLGSVMEIPGFTRDNAVMIKRHSKVEIWVNPHFLKHRDAWQAAVKYHKERDSTAGGIAPAVQPIPGKHQVDHMYNKARAKQQGYRYVRLCLLDATLNASWGGGFERIRGGIPTWDDRNKIMPQKAQPLPPLRPIDDFITHKIGGARYKEMLGLE